VGRPDRAAPPKPLPKCDAFTRLPRQLVSVVLGLGALAALWFLLAPAAPKKSGSVPVRGSASSDLALGVATVPV